MICLIDRARCMVRGSLFSPAQLCQEEEDNEHVPQTCTWQYAIGPRSTINVTPFLTSRAAWRACAVTQAADRTAHCALVVDLKGHRRRRLSKLWERA